jgi:hypothetical protein
MLLPRTLFVFFTVVPFVMGQGCDGNDDSDSGVDFEKPQIWPVENPICFSSLQPPVEVGKVVLRNVLLENRGRQSLEISSAMVVNDRRMHLSLGRLERMVVPTRELTIAEVRYAPAAPGWDTAALQIFSNAENFPELDIFIIGRAEPANLDGGVYDAGPRPAEAEGSGCP